MITNAEHKELRKHFLTTLYDTLSGVVSPTPCLEISEGKNIDVRYLNGKARLPKPNSTEVTVLDIDAASLFFDNFHILYEGVTGTGKTYTSDALFDTVFGPDGHYNLRLSGGVLGSSALEPFTTTTLENGVPKTRIDQAKCRQYGALFIDEINRGDSQEVFQVVDGKIHVNGDTGYLGVPIPGTDRTKALAIIAAMNPADALHSSALELDIAGENRFLKFKFPNGVAEAGSSQLEKIAGDKLHDKFWTEFGRRTGKKGGWRENYPVVTDPEQFANSLDGETKEFIDVALGYVGYDPKETYERNVELMQEAQVQPRFTIQSTNDYTKILEAQGKLKHGFVRRDLRKIKDLSNLLAFVKGVKSGTFETNVNLNDVAASIGLILESKTVTGTDTGGLLALVNDARASYSGIHGQMNIPAGYGLRQAVWQAAVQAGTENGFDAYAGTLKQGIDALNTQATGVAQSTLKSRLISDLVVLDHFSRAHEQEVKDVLKLKGEEPFKAFRELYQAKKSQGSIYEHRLDSVIGG